MVVINNIMIIDASKKPESGPVKYCGPALASTGAVQAEGPRGREALENGFPLFF